MGHLHVELLLNSCLPLCLCGNDVRLPVEKSGLKMLSTFIEEDRRQASECEHLTAPTTFGQPNIMCTATLLCDGAFF